MRVLLFILTLALYYQIKRRFWNWQDKLGTEDEWEGGGGGGGGRGGEQGKID